LVEPHDVGSGCGHLVIALVDEALAFVPQRGEFVVGYDLLEDEEPLILELLSRAL
jgi:hypothetical protein